MNQSAKLSPRVLWDIAFRRRMRPQVILWVVAALCAVLIGRSAIDATGLIERAAIAGGLLGIPVPWFSSLIGGQTMSNGIIALSWYRRRFSGDADALINRGDVAGAAGLIRTRQPASAWEQFDLERVKASLELAAGGRPALVEVRAAAKRLEGVERVRADGAIGILESIQLASDGGDWLARVAEVGPMVREDRDYGQSTRRRNLALVAAFSFIVVAAASSAIALAAILLGFWSA